MTMTISGLKLTELEPDIVDALRRAAVRDNDVYLPQIDETLYKKNAASFDRTRR